jgi:hypothetical protein
MAVASPDSTLIELEDLKEELRITHGLEDGRLEKIAYRATSIVLDYLEANDMVLVSPAEWEIATVPLHVQSAILQVAVNLYRHPGDEGGEDGPVTQRVKNSLERERTPVVS